MKSRKIRTSSRPRQRGAILAALGIALMAFFAIAMVGIDVGRLGFTAAETQSVADAAAHAGALAIISGGNIDTEARAVADRNSADGHTVAGSDLVIEPGHYDFSNCTPDATTGEGCFTSGGVPTNAVRATASVTVNNFLAGIFGTPETTVTKLAVAGVGPPREVTPTLPVVLGECCFPDDCTDNSCLPGRQSSAGADNQAFTGYFGQASTNNILSYFPAPCGGGLSAPGISIGDNVSSTEAEAANQMRAMRCMACEPSIQPKEFLVPVIECISGSCGTSQFNQDRKVVGFATIVINGFRFPNGQERRDGQMCQGYSGPSGGQAPNVVYYHSVTREDVVGTGVSNDDDCPGCPVDNVAMVQ